MHAAPLIVAGDIGGTNSRFSVYRAPAGAAEGDLSGQTLVHSESYKNADFATFHDVFARFLHEAGLAVGAVAAACLAVAGPVADNRARLTNVGFVVAGADLAAAFGIPFVVLVNDFVANGYGLLALAPAELVAVQDRPRVAGAPIACIGAGTGLGETFLTRGAHGAYEAHPSEGGHVEYAPATPLEADLLAFLRDKYRGRISVERVVAGMGLASAYEFLQARHPEQVNAVHAERIAHAREPGAAVGALAYDDPLCRDAVALFSAAYGREVGNMALKFLPFGGLYIAGGIAPKLKEFLLPPAGASQATPFTAALLDKGRLSEVVAQIPIYLVLAEDLGMRGARVVAARALAPQATMATAAAAAAAAAAVAPEEKPFAPSPEATLVFGAALGVFAGVVACRVLARSFPGRFF